jgi:hypothetical protein
MAGLLDESCPDRGRLLMRAGEAGMGKMLLAEGALENGWPSAPA